ncbi:unnamed protein product [Macrosiphum euphorbiae]|uniref:Uncharacterized protein n=1 Tax=Macrosiphum euphorbiae TaxID=13131 RepID=A0AAV0XNX2_9HEMI|nr:unnamed protein product [Macrosiphum euphorbiae]
MKRTQQSFLHFHKKSKQSTESVDETVPSTSNVLQDDDIMATLETEKTAPSPPVISPVIEPSLKCLDSKFDIGGYVECKNNLSDEEKVSILQNVWTPCNGITQFMYNAHNNKYYLCRKRPRRPHPKVVIARIDASDHNNFPRAPTCHAPLNSKGVAFVYTYI